MTAMMIMRFVKTVEILEKCLFIWSLEVKGS